jgi:hypothetical protein
MNEKPSMGGRILAAVQREPLVLFVVLGAMMFGIWTHVAPDVPEPLWIDGNAVRALQARQQEALGGPMTERELREAREDFIDDEVLLREAIDRRLHLTDPMVRHRLMEIVRGSLVETEPQPSIAQLQEFFSENIERFSPETVTLDHVFFPWDDPASAGKIDRALVALRSGADPALLVGDASLTVRHLPMATRADLVEIFGPGFADRMEGLPEGEWKGPIASDHGRHLVRIVDRHPRRAPSFDDMEWYLRQEYTSTHLRQVQRARIAEIRRKYDIRFREN